MASVALIAQPLAPAAARSFALASFGRHRHLRGCACRSAVATSILVVQLAMTPVAAYLDAGQIRPPAARSESFASRRSTHTLLWEPVQACR
jgi:hypothetical protein